MSITIEVIRGYIRGLSSFGGSGRGGEVEVEQSFIFGYLKGGRNQSTSKKTLPINTRIFHPNVKSNTIRFKVNTSFLF